MSIGYLYSGNKENIKKLLNYNLTIITLKSKDIDELKDFNVNIIRLDCVKDRFDIIIYDGEYTPYLKANKRVIIGNKIVPRFETIKEFDIDKILAKPIKGDIKFSIIVPNYNNAEWINKTIESVLIQTYQNWEMYIIDDLSTDNSIEVIKKYQDKRITLIQSDIKLYNGGSRNVGILKAKKSNPNGYLLFIDSDDWLANNHVLEGLNDFIDGEDLITLDYSHYMGGVISPAGKCSYQSKDDLFMTYGCMCAVWCKCFKVSVAPLFEFNTLMEDRNYHYKLINRIDTFANYGEVTHIWNKDNKKSVTSDKTQQYESDIQTPLEWGHCAYRHIAGMLDLLNEITNPSWRKFIQDRIAMCKRKVENNVYEQY